ncbi:MAG: glycosyltransferase [Bryobacteraceae bacterium]|jgi:glycosyltransferase involved in cell wall biosynthesis
MTIAGQLDTVFYAGGFAPTGGIETFACSLLRGLTSRGERAGLICWGGRSPLVTALERDGIPVYRAPWRWGCRWRLPDSLLFLRSREPIRNARTVVFGKPMPWSIQQGIAAIRPKPRCVLITPYRPAEMWGSRGPGPEYLACFEAVIVQAPSFAADLRRFGYGGEITVLPYLPPEPAVNINPPPPGRVRIGFLGRLAAQKNLSCLLRASGQLLASFDFELHFFGDGSEAKPARLLAKQLGLDKIAFFHGNIPHNRIIAAIDSCHFFAFASTSEGQCLAALEILARGRPILATPAGAFPDILRDALFGTMAPPTAFEQYTAALTSLVEAAEGNQIDYASIRDGYARRFSYSDTLDSYCRLLLPHCSSGVLRGN